MELFFNYAGSKKIKKDSRWGNPFRNVESRLDLLDVITHLGLGFVVQRLYFSLVRTGGDFPALFIEQTGDTETLGHFSHGNNRLHANGQINSAVRLFVRANGVEPVLMMHRNVFAGGRQVRKILGINFVRKRFFGFQLDAIAAEEKIGMMTANDRGQSVLVDGAAGGENAITTREFGQQLDVFGNGPHVRLRRVLVRMNGLVANADDAHRKFRVSAREHQGMQAVWKEIAQHTRAERIIFAPSEIEIGIKVFGVVVFDGPAPGVPIDVFLSRVRVDSVIPFALGSVSHVRILAQNELPNFT